MFSRLFLLFLVTPIVELFLLIRLGQIVGTGPTLGLIVVTAIVGSWLTRREGLSAWQRVQLALGEGRVPGTEILDGLIILVCGALLLTPGVLTDAIGFAGLLPQTRSIIRSALARRFKSSVERGSVRVHFRTHEAHEHADVRSPTGNEKSGGNHVSPRSDRSGYDTTFGGTASRRPSHGADD